MPFDEYYFHPAKESLFAFTRAGTTQIFSYFFENQYIAVSLLLLFLAAVALQFFRDWRGRRDPDLVRGRGLLFVIPFVAVWGASLAGIYPYVGGRHTVFLAPFVMAALSGLLAGVYGRKLWAALVIGLLLTAATNLSGKIYERGMTRADQSRELMLGAMQYLRQSIPGDGLILTDYQSSTALAYYFCGPKQIFAVEKSAEDYFEFGCNGRSFVVLQKYNVPAREFVSRFRATAQSRGFQPGERIWYFEEGWGPKLDRTLPWMAPGFRCLTSQRFGANISVIPLTVNSDLSPASPVTNCPPPAFNSFAE